jgi:hypothetical protein
LIGRHLWRQRRRRFAWLQPEIVSGDILAELRT